MTTFSVVMQSEAADFVAPLQPAEGADTHKSEEQVEAILLGLNSQFALERSRAGAQLQKVLVTAGANHSILTCSSLTASQ